MIGSSCHCYFTEGVYMCHVWSDIESLVQDFQVILPEKGRQIKIKELICRREGDNICSFSDDSNKEWRACILFSPFHMEKVFQSLTLNDQHEGLVLKANAIELTKIDNNLKVKFDWLGGNSEESHRGKLTFMRIDVSRKAFVSYYKYLDSSITNSVEKKGISELFESVPDSWDDLSQVLGIPIPHQIDYDAFSQEIFQRSRIESIAEAMRKVLELSL